MAVSQEIERFSSYGFVTIGNKMNTYHGVAKETTLLSRKGILIDTCGGNFVGK
jgi:hypothetical protein